MTDDTLLRIARECIKKAGFSLDYSKAKSEIERYKSYWEINYYIETADPDNTTGGEGYQVRLRYPSAECIDVLGHQ